MRIVMPMSLPWPESLKTPADNADNTAISCAVRCDVVLVGGRIIASTWADHKIHDLLEEMPLNDRGH